MSLRFTMMLCASTAIVGLSGVHATMAQSDQPTASAGSGLEEIVVTARRKEERAQSIPIAITAFSQADIEKKQINQVKDLIKDVAHVIYARRARFNCAETSYTKPSWIDRECQEVR